MQPVFTTISTPCHTSRCLAGHPQCVSVGNGYGYTLQFARRPPHFHGVLATAVRSEDAQVLRAKVMNLLEKEPQKSFLQPRASQAFTAAAS